MWQKTGLSSCRVLRQGSLTPGARRGRASAALDAGLNLPSPWPYGSVAGSANVGADKVRKPPKCHLRGLHVTSAVRRLGHPHPHSTALPYKERHIVVTTCGELYKKWRAEGRLGYKHAPDTGAVVPLTYVHTGMDRAEHKERGERPLVLVFTGSPGQYQDFSYTIPFLNRHGADVLCFNWPNFSFTEKTRYWWHSSEEKAQLATDFLKELDIKEVDMLVSHSSGAYPAVQLTAEQSDVQVKSLALLMPTTGTDVSAARSLAVNLKPMEWMLRNMYGLSVLAAFTKWVMKLNGHPLKPNMNDVFFAYLSTTSIDDTRYERQLTTLRERGVPMVVMISGTDKLISTENNRKFLRKLGHDPGRTWLYDSKGNLISRGEYGTVKVVEMTTGSHYAFSRHSDVCNQELLELLSRASLYPKRFRA
ncbi:uncharacterized protein [Dermacentor andersoni]|uniref:uncharacterized protein n=1 Tax=Dermacentor andersoni TaxID=34620 RepID=UPI002417C37F|nr:uncharacterized protein LOC129386211 [Dermacentor andersoni]XP_054929818.1 uncharacterized protein LOC129386211 [Dermacentor andersoni]